MFVLAYYSDCSDAVVATAAAVAVVVALRESTNIKLIFLFFFYLDINETPRNVTLIDGFQSIIGNRSVVQIVDGAVYRPFEIVYMNRPIHIIGKSQQRPQ